MEIIRYVLTVADYGFGNDGKARVLGHFKSYNEAVDYLKEEIETFKESHEDFEFDMESFDAWDKEDASTGCSWNIEACRIPIEMK